MHYGVKVERYIFVRPVQHHMIEVIVKVRRIVHRQAWVVILRTVEQIERIMVFEVVIDGASDVCDAPKCDELTTKAMDNHPIIL